MLTETATTEINVKKTIKKVPLIGKTSSIFVKREVDKTKNAKTLDLYSNNVKNDKFYTKESVAIACLDVLNLLDSYDLVVEPSAGNGNFYRNIKHKNKVGLDIVPECKSICEQDWFTYVIDKSYKNVLVVGNPPFGIDSKMAVKFIKHAASFDNVKTIAFILPDTFNKHTKQKHVPLAYRLKHSIKLPPDSFEVNGISYHVPCTFFVFEKSIGEDLRFQPELYVDTKDFVFGTASHNDFFVRGASPRKVEGTPKSTIRGYYISVRKGVDVERVRNNFKMGIWSGNSSVSKGNCWFTKPELILHYRNQYEGV